MADLSTVTLPNNVTYNLKDPRVPANAVFTDTTYDVATLSEDGLMSTNDRAFLTALASSAYLNGAEVPKGDPNNTEKVTNYAVCSTAAATTAKVADTGWDFSLYTGAIVFIKFTVTNTGAVASLTLNVNDTGAIGIKYRNANLSSAGVLAANRIYAFVYDGTYWQLVGDLDTNSNTYDRTSINTTFKAATATSASFLLCGTDAGYKNVAKGTAFDISYPLLYCGTAIAASGTRSDGYIQIPMNCTTTNGGTSPAFTVGKMVFLKGKLTAGKTFTIDSSTLFTQTVPTTADGYHYYCVGLAGSATNLFLTPHHDIYEYLGGSFHKVSVYAEDAAKVNGLTVQTAVPANALFTDTNTWRNVTVNGTAWKGTGTGTGAMNFVSGSNIAITASGNNLTIEADHLQTEMEYNDVVVYPNAWTFLTNYNLYTADVSFTGSCSEMDTTASDTVIVSPDADAFSALYPLSYQEWAKCNIRVRSVVSGTISFIADSQPTENILVHLSGFYGN